MPACALSISGKHLARNLDKELGKEKAPAGRQNLGQVVRYGVQNLGSESDPKPAGASHPNFSSNQLGPPSPRRNSNDAGAPLTPSSSRP